ncbi:MAG: tRNA 2-selenouridine synthase [Chitinophagales bacterium]|jgi:tRNA 2-selenouridine synthase
MVASKIKDRTDSDNYLQLFLDDVPMMDVRAPIEFAKGAFPYSANIPLLDDQQREQIGIQYKNAGEEEAIELGLKLATPDIRAERLEQWLDFCRGHAQGYLYCFRGGLRSRTTQSWIREQGVEFPLVKGGYKAMRRFLIDELATSVDQLPFVIVSGLTGSGKTRVLQQIQHHVDLEGIANHRGSAFGRAASDIQPSVIDLENQISIELLKHRHHFPGKPVFLEDEGRCIGRVNMPEILYKKMQKAPRAILEVDVESRIQLISEDYIENAWPQYQALYGDLAEVEFSRYILENLARIQKRLGGDKYKQVRQCFEAALIQFYVDQDSSEFYDGIHTLLVDYYDPMYRYQLSNKDVDIIFQGPEDSYLEWAEDTIQNV